MTVKVKDSLSSLTDGRERFAGRTGTVDHRGALGRILKVGEDSEGEDIMQHFDAAYEVRFDDGDEATFLSNELEVSDGEPPLIPFVSSDEKLVTPESQRADEANASERARIKQINVEKQG